MDEKTLHLLELPKVLSRLEAFAAFSASKELARELMPTSDIESARQRQRGTTEARNLLRDRPEATVGGAHDVRADAERAARGAVLDPVDLLDLKATLISGRTLSRVIEKAGEGFPVLNELAAGLDIPQRLIETISRILDERGEVLDSASERLGEIRATLRAAQDRLRSRLDRMVHDPKMAPMLQEPIVTQRDGRFVVPLRSEFKGRIRAVIHDQSASGATLYVEPLAIVDLNNQVRELELAERDEIQKILAEVSNEVGAAAESIRQTVGALAEIDLAFAKALYADDLAAHEPVLRGFDQASADHPGSTLHLRRARHPLLEPAQAVPVDLILDDATFALVITGPNTGGKTVALKTAGLLILMAQCGLHLPTAPDSAISVFESVFADIGDEQSIEQSLSTFSGHIATIIRILEAAGPRSLVLLDELGAGTDPEEGSALARAILATLLERRSTTLVATHYPELKAFAHTTPGVRNASVEFDLASLRPTYHLSIGLPGRSNALAIATRLGLDPEVIERARAMVAPDAQRAEGLLEEIHQQRAEAARERHAAEIARKEAEAARAELKDRLRSIEDERREILEAARREAAAEAEAVFQEAAALRRKLSKAARTTAEVEAAAAAAENLAAQAAPPPRPRPVPEHPLRIGDRVYLRSLGSTGVVASIGEHAAEVQVGRLRVRASVDELARAEEPAVSAPVAQGTVSTPVSSVAPPLEIDVRGLTVDEALDVIDRQLDAAVAAGMPFVRIIHGKGTGRLRQAIRQAMRESPYAAGTDRAGDSEGGEGVTVVRLVSG